MARWSAGLRAAARLHARSHTKRCGAAWYESVVRSRWSMCRHHAAELLAAAPLRLRGLAAPRALARSAITDRAPVAAAVTGISHGADREPVDITVEAQVSRQQAQLMPFEARASTSRYV